MEKLNILLSTLILFGVIMTLVSSNLIHVVFWLTITFSLSSLYIYSISIKSIASILILIYMGAIAILFIFSIMMLDLIITNNIYSLKIGYLPAGILVLILFLFLSNSLFWDLSVNNSNHLNFESNSSLFVLGKTIFNFQSWAILGSGFLLLIPMMGALIFIKWLFYFCF